MHSKPPESKRPPTPNDILRHTDAFRKATAPDKLAVEGYVTELSVAFQFGENPNSAQRFVALLSSIPPARLSGCIPGQEGTLRDLVERISTNSVHDSVRQAAHALLVKEARARTIARTDPGVPSAKRALPAEMRILYPHPSKPPLRDQALEILRNHVEGNGPQAAEVDLRNAIEVVKFDKTNEVVSVLAHVASLSPIPAVQEKARDALCNF